MRKIINFTLIIFIFLSSLFAEEVVEYKINLEDVESFRIGFSDHPVYSFEHVDFLKDTQYLVLEEGAFHGEFPSDSVYVFWQIQSSNDYEISLSADAMISVSRDDVLNVQLSTEEVEKDTISPAFFDDGDAKTFDMSSSSSASGGVIFSYSGTKAVNRQAVGSQKIMLNTENFEGRPADTYLGTLTLTISEVGDSGR